MATWDKNKPAGSQKLRLSDEEIRANNDALEDALARNHDFPGAYGTDAGEHIVIDLQNQSGDPSAPTGKIKLYAKTVGAQPRPYIKDPASAVKAVAIVGEDTFAAGTKMLFYQDTAPTGWTIQNTLDDKLVYITKGSAAGGQTGGGVHSGGTWTISGLGGTVASHTLTETEIPSHLHTVPAASGGGATPNLPILGTYNPSTINTGSTGGGAGHSHGFTASHDGSWRPSAYCAIICAKT